MTNQEKLNYTSERDGYFIEGIAHDSDGSEIRLEGGEAIFLSDALACIDDEDIAIHYGQIWDNVQHMTSFIENLRNRYIQENL